MTTKATSATPPLGAASAAETVSLSFALEGRTVLLAMDGSTAAAAAARVAHALAAAHGAVVHVLRVIDSRTVPFPPAMDVALAIGDPDRDLTSHLKEVQDVRSLLEGITGPDIDWPVRVTIGAPAHTIVDEARRLDAALVIIGLHKYGRVSRALNNETPLSITRTCSSPVLGVTADASTLPTRILGATDFSAASLAASRVAISIADAGATLTLAYVPPITAILGDEGERTIHELGVQSAFEHATRQLGQAGITFDYIVLEHDLAVSTAAALLEYAERTGCDLIAAGSARRGHIERWMTGSVSTALVRDGSRSVLILPATRM